MLDQADQDHNIMCWTKWKHAHSRDFIVCDFMCEGRESKAAEKALKNMNGLWDFKPNTKY